MPLYQAFGLTIECPFDLPAEPLYDPAATQQVDLAILCNQFLEARRYSFARECSISTQPDEIVMRWEDYGEFRLCAGKQIVIRPRPGVSTDILNLLISGSVFAMLLYQRGMTVLHGSVVEVEGQGVAFLAPKGFGKSTLALALHRLGAILVSDDIVAIPTTTPDPLAIPGFAQAKLWPDSLHQLGYRVEHHTKLYDGVDKRGVALSTLEQAAVPLRHIFILGIGQELALLPLNQNQAFLSLLPHWYLARYGTATVREVGATATQFSQCLALAQKTQVTALARPMSLGELPTTARAVWDYVVQSDIRPVAPPLKTESPDIQPDRPLLVEQ